MINIEQLEKMKHGILSAEEFEIIKNKINSPIEQKTPIVFQKQEIVESENIKRPFRTLSFTSYYKLPGKSFDQHYTYYITVSFALNDAGEIVPFELIIRSDLVSNIDLYKFIGKTISFLLRTSALDEINKYIEALDGL